MSHHQDHRIVPSDEKKYQEGIESELKDESFWTSAAANIFKGNKTQLLDDQSVDYRKSATDNKQNREFKKGLLSSKSFTLANVIGDDDDDEEEGFQWPSFLRFYSNANKDVDDEFVNARTLFHDILLGDDKSLRKLIKQSENNDMLSTAYLAIFYRSGFKTIVKANDDKSLDLATKAIPWLTKQVSSNHADAQCILGFYYENGIGVLADYDEAFRLYQLAAKENLPEALNALGRCYELGTGVETDFAVAVEYYRAAADQGYPDANFNLGQCYDEGRGVEMNKQEALRYYTLASDQNHPKAQYNLGNFYQNGIIVEKNDEEAARLYKLAAKRGLPQAQFSAALCFDIGVGVPKNPIKAARLYKLAATQGHVESIFFLANCYYFGNGVPKDKSKAFKLYKMAAKHDSAEAIYTIGTCYEDGQGTDKNMDEALKYYKQAADMDNTDAIYKLGTFYEKGYCMDRKLPQEAVKLYWIGAKRLHNDSLLALANCYKKGIGVEANELEANKLLKIAKKELSEL